MRESDGADYGSRHLAPPVTTWRLMLVAGTFFVGLGEAFDPGLGPGAPVGGFIAIPPRHPRFA
jgi:hypothetical protein